MSDDNKYICAILCPGQIGDTVIGMGILVKEREVLTCAHVVKEALGKTPLKDGILRVRFPFGTSGSPASPSSDFIVYGRADETRYYPRQDNKRSKATDDIAVILLQDNENTKHLTPAKLRKHQKNDKNEVKIYGYRQLTGTSGKIESHPHGEFMEGKISGDLPLGLGQFEGTSSTGATVERGFSGSGVYSPDQEAVVGMIVEADTNRTRKIAQFIDVPSLELALGREKPSWGNRLAAATIAVAVIAVALIAITVLYVHAHLPESQSQKIHAVSRSGQITGTHSAQTANKQAGPEPLTKLKRTISHLQSSETASNPTDGVMEGKCTGPPVQITMTESSQVIATSALDKATLQHIQKKLSSYSGGELRCPRTRYYHEDEHENKHVDVSTWSPVELNHSGQQYSSFDVLANDEHQQYRVWLAYRCVDHAWRYYEEASGVHEAKGESCPNPQEGEH